jgi:DNA-binding winged helix-turn-helix (wHTH) protein
MRDTATSEPRVSLLPTIERERLIAEFRAADPQVVKLIAPAGYGKTTLAAALATPNESVARCDCLHMRSPIDLVRGVLEAIGNTLPEPDRLAIANAFISLGDDQAEWLRYARRVFQLDRKPGLLVFDNGEALVDKPEVRSSIERLLGEISPTLRIVFCSRVDVPVNFARFAGPERTMRIGPDELRFDRVEIALLLSRVGASSSVVARVDTFTQGWPMLVMMLFVLAKRGRLEAYLSGSGPDVNDLYGYLASEVLATLEPWARDLLEAVVALPDARQSDLEAVYGNATGARLAELELATPFLSRTPRGTFDIHPAIAEMLRKESTRGAELAREIFGALAPSQPVRAARIAAHLGDYDRAASLLENARYFLRTPSLDLVDVLYALPPEALIRYPAVWNVASYSRALSRDATEWLNEADRVLAAMSEDAPIDVRVELFSGFMNVYTQRGEFEKARSFSAVFAQTPAGKDPIGQITIRFWELVASCFLGQFIDRDQWQREVGPIMRVKTIEIILDHDAFARHERLAGDPVKERAILGRAVEEARASGDIVLRYLTLTEALFGAWFWGDDARFNAFVTDFERAIHPATERATSLLLAACRGRAATAKPGTEQLKVRTYAYLIGAAKERNLERRRKLLDEAVVSADKCGQPFTAALARIALGVADPNSAEKAFEEARSLAGRTWSTVFQEAVDHVRYERLTGHMLAAFVERYRNETPEVSAPLKRLQISLAQGTVRVADRDIVLSGREFELLVFLALRNSPASTEILTEALWPESDADRARSSLKVTLSRLRSRLGDNSLIVSTHNGYTLAAEQALDIGSFLKHAQIPELIPPRIQLEAARQRLSRWGWAKTFDDSVAALETLPNSTAI